MSQPKGFESPTAALLAVSVCLADFSIPSNPSEGVEPVDLVPRMFVGDEGVGGVIDCCSGGLPILRIEGGGELPADGLPMTLSKHGCVDFVERIRVTFLTCFKTMTKSGQVVTDPDELGYGLVIQAARWDAVGQLRCCQNSAIRYVSSTPIGTDGKCSGFQIDLLAPVSLCGPCTETESS